MANTSLTRSDTVYTIVGEEARSPFLIDVSRSGTHYPPEFLPRAAFDSVHKKISPYVERLVLPCAENGATILMATFPPTVIDPNRPIDDIDDELLDRPWPTALAPLPASLKKGTGLIHSQGADYEPLYDRKLSVREVEKRIATYYVPYHSKLSELLEARRSTYGEAYQLTCHSMSSVGPMDGQKRPDICLGDLDGATASESYVDAAGTAFRDAGFEVALNKPFRGNELLRRHGSPATGTYSLQVEVRRDLYLDETTRELHDGLIELQQCFKKIVDSVRSLSQKH